jgi:hypothetical protein
MIAAIEARLRNGPARTTSTTREGRITKGRISWVDYGSGSGFPR